MSIYYITLKHHIQACNPAAVEAKIRKNADFAFPLTGHSRLYRPKLV